MLHSIPASCIVVQTMDELSRLAWGCMARTRTTGWGSNGGIDPVDGTLKVASEIAVLDTSSHNQMNSHSQVVVLPLV